MNIKARLERLEVNVITTDSPLREIILQAVERTQNGEFFAIGEQRVAIGSGEDFSPYVEYEKPIPLHETEKDATRTGGVDSPANDMLR